MVFKSQEQGPMVNYPDFIQISDKDSYYSDDFLQFNDYESDTDSTTDESEIVSETLASVQKSANFAKFTKK